jgi:hypothetical protein
MPNPTTTALFILGMHRSGTSALTRVVNLLGAELSDKLMPPRPDNERGFWEQDEVVPIHEALLLDMHAQWCDPFFLPEKFETLPLAAPHADKLGSIVKERFGHSPLWALKDPRLSVLLPIWKPILKNHAIHPIYLIALRHPIEVARSLEKRDQMPISHGCALWLHYTLKSLIHTNGENRLLISYDSLLENWRGVAANIACVMKSEWLNNPDSAAPQIETFLSKNLRHHQATGTDSGCYYVDTANQLYDQLIKDDGKNPAPTDAYEKIADEFQQKSGILRFSAAHASHRLLITQNKLTVQEERNHQLQHALNVLKSQVEDLMKDHADTWESVKQQQMRFRPFATIMQLFSKK